MVIIKKVTKVGQPNKANDKKIELDCFGMPVPKMPLNMSVGKAPADPKLKQEWLLHNVEKLMLQGTRSSSRIAALVGITHPTARIYMDRIEFRWKLDKSRESKAIAVGEGKARLDLITRHIWGIYENTSSDSRKLRCLQALRKVHDAHCFADGLTPSILAEFALARDGEAAMDLKKIDHESLLRTIHALDRYLASTDENRTANE